MLPFGETVLSWRLARGMSQADLARAAGLSRPNLSAVERGHREVTLGTLRRLAQALDVLPGVLANGEAPAPMNEPLGRAALERVARAAAHGTPTANQREQQLAALLAEAASTRIAGPDAPARGAAANKRRSTRNAVRAYLLLKTMTSPAVVASLIDRLGGRNGGG